MSIEDGGPGRRQGAVPASVRAQLLATEHWGLLASRSTAQSEVLTRISMFLTFTSASVVSVALVGQATGFSDAFVLLAVVVLFIDTAIGLLTQLRVMNVAHEDLMYVTAMNRLRAAYVDLDPGVAQYLMASHHDDEAGSVQTYYFFGNRGTFSHVAGSSMIFMTTANAALIAILAGLLVTLAGAGIGAASVTGAVCGAGFLAVSAVRGNRSYRDVWRRFRPLSPTPPRCVATAATATCGGGSGRSPPPRRKGIDRPAAPDGQSMAAISSTTRSRKASTWDSS